MQKKYENKKYNATGENHEKKSRNWGGAEFEQSKAVRLYPALLW